MIPSPIRSSLATLQAHGVPCLLMGGQACVLYGGAEFSRDLDLIVAARPDALDQLQHALAALRAESIALPPFKLDALERGHAVHFRCHRPDVRDLRIDVLTRPPRLPDVESVWGRHITLPVPDGDPIPVMALRDLVATKKTQRDKDWATIGQLVEADMVAHREGTAAERLAFWLEEARDADQLISLAAAFPDLATEAAQKRPLLRAASEGGRHGLELALAQEQIDGKAADRAYWAPLRAELEQMRWGARRSDEA